MRKKVGRLASLAQLASGFKAQSDYLKLREAIGCGHKHTIPEAEREAEAQRAYKIKLDTLTRLWRQEIAALEEAEAAVQALRDDDQTDPDDLEAAIAALAVDHVNGRKIRHVLKRDNLDDVAEIPAIAYAYSLMPSGDGGGRGRGRKASVVDESAIDDLF